MEGRSIIRKIYDGTVSVMSFIGAAGIVFLMVVIVIDVLGRNLFNQPLTGTPELLRNLIVGITFLQLAHVLKSGRHIKTDVILQMLSPRGKLVLKTFANLVGLAVFALIIYSSWSPAWNALVNGHYEGEGSLRIPTFLIYALILLGSLFMVFQYAVSIYDDFAHRGKE